MCHVSPVTCHLSHVTCHLSHVKIFSSERFFIIKKKILKKTWTKRWSWLVEGLLSIGPTLSSFQLCCCIEMYIWEDICTLNSNQIYVINLYFMAFDCGPLGLSRSSGWSLCQDNLDASHTVSHVYIQFQNIADTQAQLSVLELGQKL